MKPVLFVTGHAPPDRIGAFAALHAREEIELALFGGRMQHGAGADADPEPPPVPHRRVRQRELFRLASSGRFRAVVVSTGGRVALPAAWAGARRARVPVILWASLWAHPRTPAHFLSYHLLRRCYRKADAVVTYGPHVSAYVSARGARNVYIAPQAVDNDFWSDPDVAAPAEPRWPVQATFILMFAGRVVREKGIGVLIEAWRASGLRAPAAALVLVGVGSCPPWIPAGGAVQLANEGIICMGPLNSVQLRNCYAASNAAVLPSLPTRSFREPWGLVVNEAMNRQLPVIVSDAVGATAGGLLRNERNGLVVPAGDSSALAGAIRRLAEDRALRERLGRAGASDVRAYNYEAWAAGFSAALASAHVSRDGC
ncbi:MAG TPA: glycosyltransferase family 4 protein [Solirubrobacteraceae bacterium]|jgi:glycosyltransferase involved in cell wall biosynthesis|nr:glycosyltransferase family 4 protein [Solirubrobacteraceae bacterium]